MWFFFEMLIHGTALMCSIMRYWKTVLYHSDYQTILVFSWFFQCELKNIGSYNVSCLVLFKPQTREDFNLKGSVSNP